MSDRPPEWLVLDRRFDDFDDFAGTIRGWDLEFRQLDAGRFDGALLQVATTSFQLAHASFGRTLDQRGGSPRGFRTLVVPADDWQHFLWRGHEITGGDVMVFPEDGELQSASRPGFDVFTISLPEALLAEIAVSLQLPEFVVRLRGHEVFRCPPWAMEVLRRRLRAITQRVRTHRLHLADAGAAATVGATLGEDLLVALGAGSASTERTASRARVRALKSVEELIRDDVHEPLTVGQLCRVARISERSLRRAFLEHYGVPPKRYLQALRLNGVRRELRRAHPAATRVSDVANAWGFWHLGQFAADYRRLFGELPSATLARHS